MIKNKFFTSNKSIHQLLRAIFLPYIMAAVIVTVIELIVQYNNEKAYLYNLVEETREMFRENLSLLSYNESSKELEGLGNAIVKQEHIYGILIQEKGKTKINIGQTRPGPNIFHIEFPLNQDGYSLGTASVFSSNQYVFDRMKSLVLNLLFNAIVKTLILWAIIFYYTRKLLVNPIMAIKENIETLNLANLNELNVYTPDPNEITQLRYSFNEMLERIQGGREKLVKDIIGETKDNNPFAALRDSSFRPIRRTPGAVYLGKYSYLGELGYSIALQKQMQALIDALEKYVDPVYQEILKTNRKEDIQKFAELLMNAGTEFKIEDVHRYGSNIKYLLTLKNQREKIKSSLDAYPDYLNRLKLSLERDSAKAELKITKVIKKHYPEEFEKELKDIKKEKISLVDDERD